MTRVLRTARISNVESTVCEIYHLSLFTCIITHGAFDIADPSSMQDACHSELSKYDLARHESPSSSVVRAPDWCTEGHGFDPVGDSDFFYLSHARDKLNFPSFSFLSELKIYHLSYVYSEIEIEWNAFKETAS